MSIVSTQGNFGLAVKLRMGIRKAADHLSPALSPKQYLAAMTSIGLAVRRSLWALDETSGALVRCCDFSTNANTLNCAPAFATCNVDNPIQFSLLYRNLDHLLEPTEYSSSH
jgi:hypothetical protein